MKFSFAGVVICIMYILYSWVCFIPENISRNTIPRRKKYCTKIFKYLFQHQRCPSISDLRDLCEAAYYTHLQRRMYRYKEGEGRKEFTSEKIQSSAMPRLPEVAPLMTGNREAGEGIVRTSVVNKDGRFERRTVPGWPPVVWAHHGSRSRNFMPIDNFQVTPCSA